MLSPTLAQIAVAMLAVFAVGGVLTAALYPLLAGRSRSEKRLEAIGATKQKAAVERLAAEDGRRRRNVEDALKEIEETQKANGDRAPGTTRANFVSTPSRSRLSRMSRPKSSLPTR